MLIDVRKTLNIEKKTDAISHETTGQNKTKTTNRTIPINNKKRIVIYPAISHNIRINSLESKPKP